MSKPGCGFGFSIGGGVNGEPLNPHDETDEGVFITQIVPGGASEQDGRLAVGTRILQVHIPHHSTQYNNNHLLTMLQLPTLHYKK